MKWSMLALLPGLSAPTSKNKLSRLKTALLGPSFASICPRASRGGEMVLSVHQHGSWVVHPSCAVTPLLRIKQHPRLKLEQKGRRVETLLCHRQFKVRISDYVSKTNYSALSLRFWIHFNKFMELWDQSSNFCFPIFLRIWGHTSTHVMFKFVGGLTTSWNIVNSGSPDLGSKGVSSFHCSIDVDWLVDWPVFGL